MNVITRSMSSTLNPNAPMFVPMAYQTVEDYSDEWWELVHSSPWFRDYWLQECFQDPQNTNEVSLNHHQPTPPLNIFYENNDKEEEGEEKDYFMELVTLGALKWRKTRGLADKSPKYFEKAPKIVNMKVNPRPIQQPR